MPLVLRAHKKRHTWDIGIDVEACAKKSEVTRVGTVAEYLDDVGVAGVSDTVVLNAKRTSFGN